MGVFKLLCLGLFLFSTNAAPLAGRSCLTTYSSVSIQGNDLNGVVGQASDCCQKCQVNTRCRAYTWTSFNGGTCWLKNDTQPLVSVATQETVTGILSPLENETYGLIKKYAAPDFFGDFWLDDRNGHVFGFSRFVGDNNTAWDSGLFAIQNDK
uniref:Apple domain-containing protein n=1 Tax=Acrobeloides nanus TaxID=290746 RepID=A0A914CSM8_9BILA